VECSWKTDEKDRITGEDPTLHQYLKSRKGRAMRTITHALDENGHLKTDRTEIMHIFANHMTRQQEHIPIDERRIKDLVKCGMNKLPDAANTALEDPITMDELLNAVRKGKSRKSQAQDAVSSEFYRMTWNRINQDMMDVMDLMYMNGSVTGAQKSGTILCLPKKPDPVGTEDYVPLTQLHAVYKLLTRIIAKRLRPSVCRCAS
jgi:hypothetical protein